MKQKEVDEEDQKVDDEGNEDIENRKLMKRQMTIMTKRIKLTKKIIMLRIKEIRKTRVKGRLCMRMLRRSRNSTQQNQKTKMTLTGGKKNGICNLQLIFDRRL